MCGHWGVVYSDPRRRPDTDWLERGAGALRHRGPDDGATYTRGPVGLAFRRLAIIDLAGGRQPLTDAEEGVAVVANGEVYNFRELRVELQQRGHRFQSGSDCEVLVHGWKEWGPAVAERLVGMIAFAIVDSRGQRPRVFLGRDRLGIKPLYWTLDESGLAWASEPKALLEAGRAERRGRARALLDYLVQGYCGGDESAWAGIRRLAPATTLDWQPGQEPRLRRYWDLPLDALREPGSPAELGREIREALDGVVADRLVADVPLGAFLSGGIDSTAVCDSMARVSAKPVVACSVGFHEKSHDELELAVKSAGRIGAVHHTRVLEPDPVLAVETLPWFYDEPHADPSTVPTYLVSRMAREHVTVALSGDGGDEIFAGYRRYVHDLAENRLRGALPRGSRRAFQLAGAAYPKLDWAPRVLRAKTFLANLGQDPARAYWSSVTIQSREAALALLAPDLRAAVAGHDPFQAFQAHYARPRIDDSLYRAQYADFHTYLPDQILAKVDRASMAVSLEVRVPLLDHRFAGRFANLPAEHKVRGTRGKHALREALRPRLPVEVLDGRKRGFDTPLAAWLRGPLRPALEDAIENLPRAWFDRSATQGLLRRHLEGGRDHGRELWSLLVLEHWRRRHAVRDLVA